MTHTQLERLFLAADDFETPILEEICIKAGLLWRCQACQTNNGEEDNELCNWCGAPFKVEAREGA